MQRPLSVLQHDLQLLGSEFIVETAEYVSQGLNNHCYRLVTRCTKVLLLKKFNTQRGFNQTQIEHALAPLQIVPTVFATNSQHKLALYQFIEPHHYDQSTHFKSLIDTLRTLHHAAPKEVNKIELTRLIYSFSGLTEFAHFEPKVKRVLAAITQYPVHLGFCHNDLVLENILFDKSRVWLIDFEYSGVNDVFFDLAALAQAFCMTKEAETELLSRYFRQRKIDHRILEKLSLYREVYTIVCYLWFCQQGHKKQARALLAYLNS